jgi:hypothetical protein
VLEDLVKDFDRTINLLIECKLPTAIAMERTRVRYNALLPFLKLRHTTGSAEEVEMMFLRVIDASHLEEQQEVAAQRDGTMMDDPIFTDVSRCQAWSSILQNVVGVYTTQNLCSHYMY